jgi:hypothetical protein
MIPAPARLLPSFGGGELFVRTEFNLLCALSLLGTILAIGALGQTLTTGDIVGTVLDLSGAVIPNARVSL